MYEDCQKKQCMHEREMFEVTEKAMIEVHKSELQIIQDKYDAILIDLGIATEVCKAASKYDKILSRPEGAAYGVNAFEEMRDKLKIWYTNLVKVALSPGALRGE